MKKPEPLTHTSEREYYAGIRAAEAGEPRPITYWGQRGWDFVEDRRQLDRLLDGAA